MSSTTKMYSCWKVAVTTTKKSQATTALAWLRRNVVHDCGDRPPCGREGEAVEFRSMQDEISFSPMKGAWLFGRHQGRQTMVNPVPAGGRGRIRGIPSTKRAKTPLIVLIVLSGRHDTVEFPIA